MSHRHDAGEKPRRQGKRRPSSRKEAQAERASLDFYPHSVFGQIPMIEVSTVLANGRVHAFRDYDPDYAPPLPKGAVRGSVRNQSFCRMCLDEALAAARKARRLLKGHPASDGARADSWEASCQALLGRSALARSLFERFVERSHAGKRGTTLLAEARGWLANLDRP